MDEGVSPGSAFHVTQNGHEGLAWTALANGGRVDYDTELETSLWQRAVIGFVADREIPVAGERAGGVSPAL
jgi:hypothetical protein